MELETINKLYLELSQITTARNERELLAEKMLSTRVEASRLSESNRLLGEARNALGLSIGRMRELGERDHVDCGCTYCYCKRVLSIISNVVI